MNNSKTPDHPWRTHSREFATYLDNIPRAERQQIKAAERQFLARREAAFSPQRRAVRDFCASMVGVREQVDTE